MFREAYDSLNSMHKLVPHQTLLRETTEFKDKSYLVKLVHPRDLHNARETHFRKCVHELEWHTSINSEYQCRVAKGILSEFVKHGNSVSLEEVDQINPNLGQTLRSFSNIQEGLKAATYNNNHIQGLYNDTRVERAHAKNLKSQSYLRKPYHVAQGSVYRKRNYIDLTTPYGTYKKKPKVFHVAKRKYHR